MNDLKREINQAFDQQQQSQLGDLSQTTNRMLRTATAVRPKEGQLWRSVAGVAIVLLAASAVGAAIVIRNLNPKSVTTHRPTPTARASATATPTPSLTAMSKALAVPSTTPVILFHDPADFQQIDGITWDGSASGRVGFNPVPDTGIRPNPNGTLWSTTQDIRDRRGAVVATLKTASKGFPGTWADDGRHFCTMAYANPVGQVGGVPATLQLTAVGQAPRNIAQVGRAYDQSSVAVAACSVLNDLAVVVQGNSIGQGVQFWVVRLSTGQVLWTRPSGDIRASRDGRYIAEISYDQPAPAAHTTIFGSTGTVLGYLPGPVQAFSWDGSLAVIGSYGGRATVVNWRDGPVVWTGPSNGGFQGAAPEPGGSRIAITVSDPRFPQTGGFAPGDLYIVGGDGKATELLTDVVAQF
jgi:hypothetical protein